MSNFYDNSIVPNELKRNFDVYDRIRNLILILEHIKIMSTI